MSDDRQRGDGEPAAEPVTTGPRIARDRALELESTLGMPVATPELVQQGLSQLAAEGAGGTLDLPASDRVDSAGALDPGQVIGHFVIRARLGEGGMGVVLAGVDADLDRPVAIKVVKDSPDHPAYRARLLREAKVMARLEHPNVVRVYEIGSDRGRLFIAMELVDGVTLSTWLKVQRRTWREILAMFEQVGRGLAAVHHAGLVHRDFKPDNVLVDRDGRARVADFGLARLDPDRGSSPELAASLTRTGMMVGTPAYMAPEQYYGASVDARADQYSFCVSLREALIGHRPPKVEDKLWSHVPRAVRAAINRGAELDPAERHASMDALLGVLARGARRRGLVLGLAAGGVLAIGGIATAVALASPNDHSSQAPRPDEHAVADRVIAPLVPAGDAGLASTAPAPDAHVAIAAPDASVAERATVPRASGDRTRPVTAGSGTTTIGDTVITPMTPVAETERARKHNLEGNRPTLHEMDPAHRAPVRAALKELGYLGLTMVGDDREADLKDLQAKLDASTDDLERGALMYAMGQAERARDDCRAASKHWFDARQLVHAVSQKNLDDLTTHKRREQALRFFARIILAGGFCELESGRALAATQTLDLGRKFLWGASEAERAEVWLAEAIAHWETGNHAKARELFDLAARRGSAKVRKAMDAYVAAVGVTRSP